MPMPASIVLPSNWPPRYSTIRRLLTVADLQHKRYRGALFSVGCASNGVVLSVVYLLVRRRPGCDQLRLISARKATQVESRQYQEGL